MAKSARKIIAEAVTVRVTNVRQISADLAVISYLDANHEHVDDLYNVPNKDIMNTLLLVPAGRAVDATLAPDGPDADKHPEITAAVEA